MRKIKYFFFLIALTSCNQYLGTIEPDYTPKNEVNELYSNTQIDVDNSEINVGNIIYPVVNNTKLNFSNLHLNKIMSTDKHSIIKFINDKIYLSKDKNIFTIDHSEDNNYSANVLSLKKDEHILDIFEHKDNIKIITNLSRLFIIDGDNISLINDFGIYSNTPPIIIDNILIIISVFGDIFEINLNDSYILKKGKFNPKPGISIKSNIYQDKTALYYLFNTGTLISFNIDSYEIFDNYIFEDINILSDLGVFNELIDTPFSHNDYLYFIDRSGKIAVFNYYSSQFLWELDMKNTIVNYLFSENGNLFILTLDKILILSENGNLISSYTHNKDMPISIFNIQEKIYLISKQGISYVNFVNESEDIVLKNKFTNNLNIYYEDQIIYLKDEKSLFKLSE